MTEVHLVKTLGGFTGCDPQSDEAVKAFRVGDIVRTKLTKPRNPQHHRKAMALLNLVYDNQDRYTTFDDLLTEIKLQCGWYQEHVTTGGKLIYVPKSISFSAMSQTDFAPFYERMLEVVLRDYFPDMSKAGLEEEVMSFIHGKGYAG